MAITDKRLRITRDGVLFCVGLIGIAHETLIAKADRPTLLLLFAGMIGLPAFLQRDEKSQKKQDREEASSDDHVP